MFVVYGISKSTDTQRGAGSPVDSREVSVDDLAPV